MEQVIELMKTIPRKFYLPIGLGCIGLILLVYGLWSMTGLGQSKEKMTFNKFSQENLASDSASISEKSSGSIAVDVEGAVASPSVYFIPQNSRIQDALVAAGGLSGNADRVWAAQHLNLAAKLIDGAKLYIPHVGEQVGTASFGDISAGNQGQNEQININSATSDQLDSLPGVGPVTAQKIIAGRPYASVEELQTRKIVSNSIYVKIKDSIIAY